MQASDSLTKLMSAPMKNTRKEFLFTLTLIFYHIYVSTFLVDERLG